MKNLLLTLFISALFLVSCKKGNEVQAIHERNKTDVTFYVTDFTQNVTTISKSGQSSLAVGDTLKNYADYFYYRVYNSSGMLFRTMFQTKGLNNFGKITDQLDPGIYTIVFVASKMPIDFGGGGSLNEDHLYDIANNYWDDTFFKKLNLTVGVSPISQEVRLDRIVGALEVNLHDAIPVNVSKISVVADYEVSVFKIMSEERVATTTKTREFTLAPSDKGQVNRKFLMHILNTKSPLTIHIKCYNDQNGLIAEKIINDVRCYPNKKTLLSGTLFSSVTAGFAITINPVWKPNTEPPVVFQSQ